MTTLLEGEITISLLPDWLCEVNHNGLGRVSQLISKICV